MTYVTDEQMDTIRHLILEGGTDVIDTFTRKESMTFLVVSELAFTIAAQAWFGGEPDARIKIVEFVHSTRMAYPAIDQYVDASTCIDLLEAAAIRGDRAPDASDTAKIAVSIGLLKAMAVSMEPQDVAAVFALAQRSAEELIRTIAENDRDFGVQVGILPDSEGT